MWDIKSALNRIVQQISLKISLLKTTPPICTIRYLLFNFNMERSLVVFTGAPQHNGAHHHDHLHHSKKSSARGSEKNDSNSAGGIGHRVIDLAGGFARFPGEFRARYTVRSRGTMWRCRARYPGV